MVAQLQAAHHTVAISTAAWPIGLHLSRLVTQLRLLRVIPSMQQATLLLMVLVQAVGRYLLGQI